MSSNASSRTDRHQTHWSKGGKSATTETATHAAETAAPTSKATHASVPEVVNNEVPAAQPAPAPMEHTHASGADVHSVQYTRTVGTASLVEAGPQHKPHGTVGLVIGIGGGLLFGLVPLIFLPGVGYVIAKDMSRKKHSIKMTDQSGRIVNVKLWKVGKHAPLTEDGFRLVATDRREMEMFLFLTRVIQSLGMFFIDGEQSSRFIQANQLRLRGMSLADVVAELRTKPWVACR